MSCFWLRNCILDSISFLVFFFELFREFFDQSIWAVILTSYGILFSRLLSSTVIPTQLLQPNLPLKAGAYQGISKRPECCICWGYLYFCHLCCHELSTSKIFAFDFVWWPHILLRLVQISSPRPCWTMSFTHLFLCAQRPQCKIPESPKQVVKFGKIFNTCQFPSHVSSTLYQLSPAPCNEADCLRSLVLQLIIAIFI